MSSLAKYLHMRGYDVCGSDIAVNERITALEKDGISVFIGHNAKAVLSADAVVYTDAVSSADEELVAAGENGIQCVSRMQLLAAIAEEFPFVIAVAGSHGKTSTTAMCAHVLLKSGAPFTAHIGGSDERLDNFYSNGAQYFVTEACEYKKNMLSFSGLQIAIWLNCDKDHLECYQSFDDLKESFYRYAAGAERSIVNGDDENIVPPQNAVTFGVKNKNCDYTLTSLRKSGERYAFTILERGKKLCRVKLQVAGSFHIYNALATVAAMREAGIETKKIVKGLQSFTGVKRRYEKIGSYCGATFYCDYAHHPAEVEKMLDLAHRCTDGELFVVFQPHTYSRTKFLMNEFIRVLSLAKNLVIYKTYAARESYDEAGSAYVLHEKIKNSLYAESIRELEVFIKKSVKKGDIVLFLGAGDIDYIARRLLTKLGGKETSRVRGLRRKQSKRNG